MPGNGDLEEDVEAIDTALGALKNDGTDAAAEDLEGAIEVMDGLTETAEQSESENADEAVESFGGVAETLERIGAGEGTEEDVAEAEDELTAIGQQMVAAMLETVIGDAV